MILVFDFVSYARTANYDLMTCARNIGHMSARLELSLFERSQHQFVQGEAPKLATLTGQLMLFT